MALINCKECQKEISDKANSCPHCGNPIALKQTRKPSKKQRLFFLLFFIIIVLGGSVVALYKVYNYNLHQKAEEERIANEQATIKKNQQAFDTAKEVYDVLCNTSDKNIEIMKTIYEAWHYGIYNDGSLSTDHVAKLAIETGLSKSIIEKAVEETITFSFLLTDFSSCVSVIKKVFETNGSYESIKDNISKASELLKTMTDKFDDYEHYPTLKEYYSKILSYAEFTENPTGSFQQLQDTRNDYENSIRTYRSDLSFIFD